MPIYEYECTECGLRFERRQHMSDEPISVCPTCSGKTRRVLHPAGIIFKGSGWYITDSRKGGPSAESSESKSSADSTPKAEAKSESTVKPAAESSRS